LIPDVQRDDVIRRLERRVGGGLVPDLPVVADVALGLGPDERCAGGQGLLERAQRGQLLVVHRDQVAGRPCFLARLGQDDRYRITHVPRRVGRDGRVGRLDHGGAVLVGDQPSAGEAAELLLGHVLAREHGCHSRRGKSRARVDASDPGVGHVGAHDVGVELAWPVHVVGIPALAGEKAIVFLALDGSADSRAGHRQPPIAFAPAWTAFTMLW
jgi:hypothetical protein